MRIRQFLVAMAAVLALVAFPGFADDKKEEGPVTEAGQAVGKAADKTGKAIGKAGKAVGKAGKTAGEKTADAAKTTADAGKKAGKATVEAGEDAGQATATAGQKAGKATASGVEVGAQKTAGAARATASAVSGVFTGNSKYEQPQMIEAAQKSLQAKGYYNGSIDGIMGPKTEAAILQFQRSQLMKETGKLNESTAQRLGIE